MFGTKPLVILEKDTSDDYFFFLLFSVLLHGLFKMYAMFRQLTLLTSGTSCICLPRVYFKIAGNTEFEELKERCIRRLRVDLAETFVSKLLVPLVILYYDLLKRIWLESASFFADHIAFKGQEQIVQTMFFSLFMCSIEILSGWPFSLYKSFHFEDQTGSPSLFDCLIGDLFMKYPRALQLPKYLFWVIAWSCSSLSPIGILPSIWIAETAFLTVSYEIIETLIDAFALTRLPNHVLRRERCSLDLGVLKMYFTSESFPTAKIYVFRNVVAVPMNILRLPFSGDELMSLFLRYLALVDVSCILVWRLLERLQAAVLYYLIHAMAPVDELMQAVGLNGNSYPIVLRWIIIDLYVLPVLKTILTCIRHYYNYRMEGRADGKTKLLGYDVALEAAMGKLGMFQDRFPIEDSLYEFVFQRTPAAVRRIEDLKKCPVK